MLWLLPPLCLCSLSSSYVAISATFWSLAKPTPWEGDAGLGQVAAGRDLLTDSCPTCCHHQAVSPGWAPAGPLSPIRNDVRELLPHQRAAWCQEGTPAPPNPESLWDSAIPDNSYAPCKTLLLGLKALLPAAPRVSKSILWVWAGRSYFPQFWGLLQVHCACVEVGLW